MIARGPERRSGYDRRMPRHDTASPALVFPMLAAVVVWVVGGLAVYGLLCLIWLR